MTVAQACDASGVPRPTALRWVRILEEHGLLTRSIPANDDEASQLQLTSPGLLSVSKWLRYRAALPN
ncbi:helix-turn-helix domain-containing protein [Novosphingobium sp. Gsoil 351]|uniref:helix-turn-helix domain-containing protein n=1 Tax=Novosphingobium sp. Gsoil 351 TaxID=2675225 RepID=UPI00351B10C3